ncbi:hypothetical protein PspLS_10382 [Pyricularia sp. CBS 133598]|nr:hypothetical protein PspLS_10382 [Pyricularia sp. CBS 133598]
MSKLTDFKLLCFDVYGTLIDWESGIITALKPLIAANNASPSKHELMEAIHKAEAKQQAETPTMKYPDLLAAIHPQVARNLGFSVLPTEAESRTFGESVGTWPAFPDTVDALKRLSRRYKLVVLSNVDHVGIRGSVSGPMEGFQFDAILTAEEIGSYKPDLRNFEYMLRRVEEQFGVTKDQVLQTAQSQFHDHHPAKEMGMKSAWIARYGAVMGNLETLKYDWKFATLGEMADAVEAETGA